MAEEYARTFDEAHLYMDLRPCGECGETDFDRESVLSSTPDGARVMTYRGPCSGCGTAREFVFRLSDRRSEAGGEARYGAGDEPSRLLDAGEWLAVSDFLAATARAMLDGSLLEGDGSGAPDLAGFGDEELIAVHDLLSSAVAAAVESAKFLPAGADTVPEEAIWSDSGQLLLEVYPDRLTRANLVEEVAGRRRAVAEFEERLAVVTESDA